MTAEVSGEAQEVVTMAMDKYISTQNWEAAAKLVKETMDKKFGGPWHWHCSRRPGRIWVIQVNLHHEA
jgi:hypothetical protein